MLLKNIDFDSFDDYFHMERYINIGSPSGFTEINNTSTATHPRYGRSAFYLLAVKFSANIPYREYGERPTFFKWDTLIHPDMIREPVLINSARIQPKALRVVPTASSRTVKMIRQPGWFLKLNYKNILGRMERQIGHKQALSAIEVSLRIAAAIDCQLLPAQFFFMRELFACVYDLPDQNSIYEWGIVLREQDIYPRNPRVKYLIPAFSLFSEDDKSPEDPLILVQLIRDQDKPVMSFLLEDIIYPIYASYFELLLKCGLGLECHAQNTLFAIDENHRIVGIVAKDAESIDKDLSLMETLKLSVNVQEKNWKCLRKSDYNYQIMHSFMFDFKLGEYLILPLIKAALKAFPFNEVALVDQIKTFNNRYIKQLPADYFPMDGCWYDYDNIIHDRSKARPYRSNPHPKFRYSCIG